MSETWCLRLADGKLAMERTDETMAQGGESDCIVHMVDVLESGVFSYLFGSLYEGAYGVDADRRIVQWNNASEKITGYPADEVRGGYCFYNLLKHKDLEGRELCSNSEWCPLYQTILDGVSREEHALLLRRDGARFPVLLKTFPVSDGVGRRVGALELFGEDILDGDMCGEHVDIFHAEGVGRLTGAADRRQVESRLEQCLRKREHGGMSFAFFLAGIDGFKRLYDAYGKSFAERVIAVVADMTALAVNESDMAGRWEDGAIAGVLMSSDRDALEDRLHRIGEFVNHVRIDRGAAGIVPTLSLSATVVRKGDTAEGMMERACQALSAEEGTARRCVVV